MKILIVYDSLYGNTEKIAEAIRAGFGQIEVQLKTAKNATTKDLQGIDLLVIGSPTHGGRASEQTKQFLNSIKPDSLKNIKAAAFDTGIPTEAQNGFIRFVIRFFGYASGNISKMLAKKGAKVMAAETFFVLEKEGPLKKGETERAKKWAEQLIK